MEIDFEVMMLLVTAMLFTIAYLTMGEFKSKLLVGSINIVCWFTLSLVYVASETAYPTVALIFMLIGIIFTVSLVVGSANLLGEKRGKTWR